MVNLTAGSHCFGGKLTARAAGWQKSMQKFKIQDKKFHRTVKTAKNHAMDQKQFGPLNIVITKRRASILTGSIKKRKGSKSYYADRMTFPENLGDSFHQGMLNNMEICIENINTDDELPASKSFKERRKSEITPSDTKKFAIPETPALHINNFSKENQLGKPLIPRTPHLPLAVHQMGEHRACSTIPETRLLAHTSQEGAEYCDQYSALINAPETPVVLLKEKKKDQASCATKWGPHHMQIVPETPALKLKLPDELSLYD